MNGYRNPGRPASPIRRYLWGPGVVSGIVSAEKNCTADCMNHSEFDLMALENVRSPYGRANDLYAPADRTGD